MVIGRHSTCVFQACKIRPVVIHSQKRPLYFSPEARSQAKVFSASLFTDGWTLLSILSLRVSFLFKPFNACGPQASSFIFEQPLNRKLCSPSIGLSIEHHLLRYLCLHLCFQLTLSFFNFSCLFRNAFKITSIKIHSSSWCFAGVTN